MKGLSPVVVVWDAATTVSLGRVELRVEPLPWNPVMTGQEMPLATAGESDGCLLPARTDCLLCRAADGYVGRRDYRRRQWRAQPGSPSVAQRLLPEELEDARRHGPAAHLKDAARSLLLLLSRAPLDRQEGIGGGDPGVDRRGKRTPMWSGPLVPDRIRRLI
jgi:hypothetical protein